MRTVLKSKIHRARVTEGNVDYEGSITIDKRLMEAADLVQYERVDVVDVNNGARLSTYVIEGGSGMVCLNGAAARLVARGDIVIILSYHEVADAEAISTTPRLVYVDSTNRITGTNGERSLTKDLLPSR